MMAVAAVASVGFAMNAAPASAAPRGADIDVATTDDNPGGRAHFEADGDDLRVCDQDSDGLRAVAKLGSNPWVAETRGAGHCSDFGYDLVEGAGIKLEICLQKGSSGARQFCRSAWGIS